ncbi:MAG: 6-phosphofructokinase [bacterium]|nr:6-phosphofructokinase [bacterium]MCP5069454.1 6-phosphofructokinase [bacterium]
MTTIGILVGGGPAPGINGVIGAAAIYARRQGARVLGVLEGFRWLMEGDADRYAELSISTVSRIHLLGGSILRTARANPTKKPGDLRTVVETLHKIGIDRLVTIGGDDTCYSAMRVAEEAGDAIRVAHVPKTIDNDLPLPEGIPTFGFETARETGATILSHLMEDARTTGRWYVAVMMGRSAGHLALGTAKSSGATLAIVSEEFPDGPIRLADVQRRIEASIVKRIAFNRPYGVVVISEGIGERLHPDDLARLPELPRDEHGHVRLAELPLGRLVVSGVSQGLTELGLPMTIIAKDVGYELRCVAPNAFDSEYTRDLGAGAVRCLLDGKQAVMVTREGNGIHPIPLGDILDRKTGRTRVRLLDIASPSYTMARALQVRLERQDLENPRMVQLLEETSGRRISELRERWAGALGE